MPSRFEWERGIRALPIQPPVRKLVALMLATYADKDGTNAHPGENRLAADCGIKPRAVRGHLAALRELGLIDKVFKGSSYGRAKAADEYRLLLPPDVLSRLDHRHDGADGAPGITGTTVPVIGTELPAPRCQNTGTTVPNTGTTVPDHRHHGAAHQITTKDETNQDQHSIHLPASSSVRARDESIAKGEGERELGARRHAYQPDSSNVACQTCELPQSHPRHLEAS